MNGPSIIFRVKIKRIPGTGRPDHLNPLPLMYPFDACQECVSSDCERPIEEWRSAVVRGHEFRCRICDRVRTSRVDPAEMGYPDLSVDTNQLVRLIALHHKDVESEHSSSLRRGGIPEVDATAAAIVEYVRDGQLEVTHDRTIWKILRARVATILRESGRMTFAQRVELRILARRASFLPEEAYLPDPRRPRADPGPITPSPATT